MPTNNGPHNLLNTIIFDDLDSITNAHSALIPEEVPGYFSTTASIHLGELPEASGVPEKAKSTSNTPMDINKTTLSKIVKYGSPIQSDLDLTDVVANFEKILETYEIVLRPCNEESITGTELVGIEIELETCNLIPINSKITDPVVYSELQKLLHQAWRATKDDSLRGYSLEFVSHPTQAKNIHHALRLLKLFLHTYYHKSEASYRCGTHIHVDVRNFTVGQFINMLFLYVLFEDLFYAVSGNRRKNIYCVPIRDAVTTIDQLVSLVHKSKPTYNDFIKSLKGFKKYMAYNLLPSSPYYNSGRPLGTVEFRHHEGTSNPSVLIPWIDLILHIHRTAQTMPFSEIKELIFSLNSRVNYLEFAAKVFGTVPNQVSRQQLINDMYEGSAFLKEIYIKSKGVV